jgi:hypothetical protein
MRLFGRGPRTEELAAPAVVPPRRRPVEMCFSCGRHVPPFVFFDNGHDYCLRCARDVFSHLGIRPAGQREGDISRADLVAVGLVVEALGPGPYVMR